MENGTEMLKWNLELLLNSLSEEDFSGEFGKGEEAGCKRAYKTCLQMIDDCGFLEPKIENRMKNAAEIFKWNTELLLNSLSEEEFSVLSQSFSRA